MNKKIKKKQKQRVFNRILSKAADLTTTTNKSGDEPALTMSTTTDDQSLKSNNTKPKTPNLSRKQIGSNWANTDLVKKTVIQKNITPDEQSNKPVQQNQKKIYAIDCEMVGIGIDGTGNMVARVSIVNENGNIVMDKYVKPQEKVINYRTRVSGIRPKDLESGEDFKTIQREVSVLIKNAIIVGHSIKHDLDVLYLTHPKNLTRDTSCYTYIRNTYSNGRTPSLKNLAKVILNREIQSAEHNSIEDAWATMQIYKKFKVQWEKDVKKMRNRYQ